MQAGRLASVSSLENFHEGRLRDVDFADLLHPLLTFFLLFPQFSFTGDVAAVAFCSDVLGDGADGFACDDFTADRCLDGDFELLHRDDFDEFFADGAAFAFSFGAVDEAGEGIDRLFIDADLKFDDVAFLIAIEFVIKRAVAACDRFEFVIEVGDDLIQRKAVSKQEPFCIHRFCFF